MSKTALSCFVAMTFVANGLLAAEGSKLSIPPALKPASTDSKPLTSKPLAIPAPSLKAARIGIAKGDAVSGSTQNSTAKRASAALRPRSKVDRRMATNPRTTKSAPSSRRNASTTIGNDPDQRITFRPVEVVPLKGRTPVDADEAQYPVVGEREMATDSTAEYEEEYAPLVSTDADQNFAPIISAADLPRPGRVRAASGSEERTSPDLSLPPIQPQQAAPKAKQPGRLFSALRLPEFRSRSSRQANQQ